MTVWPAAAAAPRLARLFATLSLAIAVLACRYEHSRPVIVSGKDFPCRSVMRVDGAPSPDEVIAMIGAPLERKPIGNGEMFRYSVRGQYGDRVKLLGMITVSEPHYYWSCDVSLEFRNGHLYSITDTMENSGPDGAEKDGPNTRVVRPEKPTS